MHIQYGLTCKYYVRFLNGAKIPDNTLSFNLPSVKPLIYLSVFHRQAEAIQCMYVWLLVSA